MAPNAAPSATRRPWHPFAWAAYFVVWLFAENVDEAFASELAWPLAAATLFTAVIAFAARRDIPDPGPRGVLVAGLVAITFGYGHLERLVYRVLVRTPLGYWLDDYLTMTLSIVILAALYGVYRWARVARERSGVTLFLNTAAAMSLLLAAAQIGWAWTHLNRTAIAPDAAAAGVEAAENSPDVFLFMLDAYGGVDTLRENYGVDNEPFLAALEARGFYVAREAHGNYPWTIMSLASLLNMRYVLEPEEGPRMIPVEWENYDANLKPVFRDNRVFAELRSRGYEIVTFETPHSSTELRDVDRYLTPGRSLSELQRTFLEMTFPVIVLEKAGFSVDRYLNDEDRRRRIRFVFDTAKTLGGSERPSLVFAHLMCPHAPFVFNADGTANFGTRTLTPENYQQGYAGQIQYLNTLVLDAIDAIQARLPEAVIVVQGDHGARYPGAAQLYEPRDYAREFLSTINAVHVPGGRGYETLTPGFSQVNTFRFLSNVLFGETMPFQPDISYLVAPDDPKRYLPVRWKGYEPEFVENEP